VDDEAEATERALTVESATMSSGIAMRSVVEPSMNSPGCRIMGVSVPTSMSSVKSS